MHALRLWGSSLFAVAAIAVPSFANAEAISSMRVSIDVRADASAAVSESIVYDFAGAQRHGIYRDIPETFTDSIGERESISITNVDVSDENANSYPFSTSESGGYLHIRIGDPQVLVTGTKTYLISYVAHDVVGFFTDHDELYWNVTGNTWSVPISNVGVAVWTPVDSTSHACYAGAPGSHAPCDSSVARRDGANKPIVVFTQKSLAPGEGLTVAVGFPKGVVRQPSAWERALNVLMNNDILVLPFAVAIIMFALWWKFGRDARGRGTIIPEYDAPSGVSPIAAAELVRQMITPADVSAAIIRLAVGGYLKITRVQETTFGIFKSVSYTLDKQKSAGDDLSSEEALLQDALFPGASTSVSLSDMRTTGALRKALGRIRSDVGKRMVTEGYYRANPAVVRSSFVMVGGILSGCALVLHSLTGMITISDAVALVVSGLIIILFGLIMPARTQKGALTKESILGLKEYLQIAEKNRLDFHNAPEKSPERFEALLPYAMVLGVSTAWAKEFEGVYTQPPQWYSGGVYPIFTPTSFVNEVGAFAAAAAIVVAPTSGGGGAGGGGFSGGGFGGGGGGSW